MDAKIAASSQTSRFHVDTLTTLSQEIDLNQVHISIGLKDLLVDAHLRLKAGVHYALIGRNGEGKSTLLTAISRRLIPGISDNLRILLVSQLEEGSGEPSLTVSGENVETQTDPSISVTNHVVRSDRRRERALAEQHFLLKAHESSASAFDIAKAVFSVRLLRANDELDEAKKIAQRRSGARGSEARKKLLKAEAKVVELKQRLISLDAAELLENVQNTLEALDSGTTEARARTILLGLGFKQEKLDDKFSTLSGGWRSRCSLASALLQKPDLLMLDEPTNYLDVMSVIWTQKYLETLSSTVLVVAHDRDFVDAVAQETIILRNKTLTYFDGNLSEWESHTISDRKGKLRMKEALDKKRVLIEKSIEQGARSAKKTGDENRARMVKSRKKKLDERWGMEKSDKGTRFKLNRDRSGYDLTFRREIEIEDLDRPINLEFPNPEPMRFPGALISANHITFTYPGTKKIVLDDVTVTIHPGDRVGLLGNNGEGKSTLVKVLIGMGGLRPQKGNIERHTRLQMGYFDQHSVEALSVPEISKTSSLGYFLVQVHKNHPHVDIDEGDARAILGSFGLQGRNATNPICTLSGGQKVRLALSLVIYPAPDLLVLDEVTTHLDKDTIVALIRALRKYTGAILLVTHDRHFMRCVIEGESIQTPLGTGENAEDSDDSDSDLDTKSGTVYAVGPKGKVKVLDGGTDGYIALVEKRMKKLGIS
ncbi:P-loop containing nucleoside triphosphate hydrolase protein [Crucibulum laeve]|uniref:P-loop containing nucleoside triphosphate hydrolase protein n=1 Tax=Crucibulum laeve TaxID=68775 RepID=A0A5C3LSE8_9AGAR|nr:P-loop containing nucleoside triphosphate hydrolase protein [Crucibulum laeve]